MACKNWYSYDKIFKTRFLVFSMLLIIAAICLFRVALYLREKLLISLLSEFHVNLLSLVYTFMLCPEKHAILGFFQRWSLLQLFSLFIVYVELLSI